MRKQWTSPTEIGGYVEGLTRDQMELGIRHGLFCELDRTYRRAMVAVSIIAYNDHLPVLRFP
jgi:hypothetical protein